MNSPIPFTPPLSQPFVDDEDDILLPSPGFVTDFVASQRGTEIPTLFGIWSALWVLSAASARLVSMEWLPDEPLFPNLFLFLVAPPGRCHKSTAISYAKKILMKMPGEFDGDTSLDGYLKYMLQLNWMTSKTTPDVLYELLRPGESVITGSDRIIKVNKGSQITGCISELATFLNKKKYMTGMVELLTDLYDCKDHDTVHTLARGTLELREIYITLIGGTTPTGMKESLPHEVFGEGFASRFIIVYKETTKRSFPEPVVFDGFPTLALLRKRLAWVIRNKTGSYTFSEEAREWYHDWYHRWKRAFNAREATDSKLSESRMDVNMLRVGLLLSMGSYEQDLVVGKGHLLDAERILRGTLPTGASANAAAGIASSEFQGKYAKIVEYLSKRGETTRQLLTRCMSSKGFTMKEVRDILTQLLAEGRIRVLDANGRGHDSVSWTRQETYTWLPEEQDGK